ncbi:hypothetical protein LTR70_009688 [Exophiala xenobiotica]|uniref:SnoaL-like domain-containing protein n=1 Tax=Lithohypha guttulata TaxID=1690604 RepID=A0ABR0JV65_9EURO|nr:hypothetical protein LTR24_010144 [Lithohypha guttulata]KAK5310165.1 hypothetical protein LTR70_009688 [Exophiala xenobiotica]
MAENLVQRRQQLICAAQSFIQALAEKKPPDVIFSFFSEHIIIREYGLQQLAPFLGREYRGIHYCTVLASTTSLENGRLDVTFADHEEHKVSVKGEVTFTWISTGQSWHEVRTSLLEFDHEYKINMYETWADPGAAYLASKGLLKQ